MKYPFWIPNDLLLALFLTVLLFLSTSHVVIPERASIEPSAIQLKNTEKKSQINVSKIYELDLFDTYQKELKVDAIKEAHIPLPNPPENQSIPIPSMPEPVLLEPLQVNLKGIIAFKHDVQKNKAIIQLLKTNEERVYKAGEQIEDAHIIKIFSNKIILLRTNGQQEVLYLREEDAQTDPLYNKMLGWEKIIKQTDKTTFTINVMDFVAKISSLSQFIDTLNLTTAYKKGISIGCKIGELENNSLGNYLGLTSNDIITTIDGIPATDTQNRLMIYKKILDKKDKETIKIEATRNNNPLVITYQLEYNEVLRIPKIDKKKSSTTPTTPAPQPIENTEPRESEQQELAMSNQQYEKVKHELRKKEKNAMIQDGLMIAKQESRSTTPNIC